MQDDGLMIRNESWLTAWVGPELVMMNGENGSYVSVNETGGRIWEMLAVPRTATDLCDRLAAEYDCSAAAIRSEVETFLTQMKTQGALHADTDLPA